LCSLVAAKEQHSAMADARDDATKYCYSYAISLLCRLVWQELKLVQQNFGPDVALQYGAFATR
jgi:hypothetical protein